MKWDEDDAGYVEGYPSAIHDQPFNAGKALNPTTSFRISRIALHRQGAGVIRGRVHGIRESFLPRIEFIVRTELDIYEKVLSGA